MTDRPFTVALTGGVGSGKSTVAGMLARRGAGIIDADLIAHEITQAGGSAIAPVCAAFGARAIRSDGALDRVWMRAQVFTDAVARRRLESILHPLIRNLMRERAYELAVAGTAYVVAVIPLLVESGNARERGDRILLVDCSVETQMERVISRAGIDLAMARNIIDAQASRAERLDAADDVIFSEAPLADIERAVDRLHAGYLQRALEPRPAPG